MKHYTNNTIFFSNYSFDSNLYQDGTNNGKMELVYNFMLNFIDG